jgi:hypothetical protein
VVRGPLPISSNRRTIRTVILVLATWALLISTVSACRAESPPAGQKVDAYWAGDPYRCPPGGPLTCEHLATCATKLLWPIGPPAVDSYRIYDPPDRLQDGTIISRGGWHVVVVFYPTDDGPPRAVQVRETDNC